MVDKTEICSKCIQRVIDSFEGSVFKTIDVIRDYYDGFYSDKDTPAAISANARFGKYLKKNQDQFKIMEINKGVRVLDDNDHPTKSSEWQSVK